MAYKTIYTEVEVDVDISEFSTDDLLDELASRSSLPIEEDFHGKELLEKIWLKRRVGNSNYQEELDRLIYEVLGYVV
jgi:predicted Zn-dependent protease with MMP-like domain